MAEARERGLSNPHVQEALLGEATAAATVGILVWDDTSRYVAANAHACALLGCSLEEIIGAPVGRQTADGSKIVERAADSGKTHGRLTANRFDGSGPVVLEFLTFQTRAAGLPYMGSVIWQADEG